MSRHFDPEKPELMDCAEAASPELERDLLALESLNRPFGSHRLLRHFLARWWTPQRCYRVLDLCTGGGDLPRMMVAWARARGITLRIDALDANPHTIEIARRLSAGFPEIEYHCADVLHHESDASYDLVHCSLALHHFGDDDAIRLLRRCREFSTRWVLVSDIERHPATTLGVWLLTALLYRDPMTVHDARLSARRAFSHRELAALARAAGWPAFGHARFLCCRQAVWLENREFAGIPVEVAGVPGLA